MALTSNAQAQDIKEFPNSKPGIPSGAWHFLPGSLGSGGCYSATGIVLSEVFKILPVAFRGKAGKTTTFRGTL